MEKKSENRAGFTLIEVIAALTIFVGAMALAMAGFMFLLKNTNQENAQNELDIDVQQTMERLKHDLRLSSLDNIFYHADPSGKFQALSFPLGQDTDGNGILDKDSDGNLLWGKQIVYHIKLTTPNELIRTVFNPRDPDLEDYQRQEQLEDVVAAGDGGSTYNSGNATSTTLFKNMLKWEILQTAGRYDAYNDSPFNIREEASLGYTLIAPGSHDFTFTVVDTNASSGGMNIGIDQLYVSPSYGAREAENQIVKENIGATASPMHMPIGSWKGQYQLFFEATAISNNFTLTMENDRWEESNFSKGTPTDDVTITWDTSVTPSEYVVQLEGWKKTWEAPGQTGDFSGSTPSNLTGTTTTHILMRGADEPNNGRWIDYNGKQCKLTFRASSASTLSIDNVFIEEPLLGTTKPVTFSSGFTTATTTNNGTIISDWVNFNINKKTNYYVTATAISGNSLKKWTDSYTDPSGYIAGISTNGTSFEDTDYILGLESVFVSYPTNGVYTSRIFDTHLDNPKYGILTKTSDESGDTSITIAVRTGDQYNLAGIPWSESKSGPSFPVPAANKRFIQFQATLHSTDGMNTPKLRDVTIKWTGKERLVNIGGVFTKGDDYGIFTIDVDGSPLRSALIIELEIYKNNVRGMNGENRTISSALKVDMTPRNTGLHKE